MSIFNEKIKYQNKFIFMLLKKILVQISKIMDSGKSSDGEISLINDNSSEFEQSNEK